MWQRFSRYARDAVFRAQEAAQRFGDGYVSTEHLTLGLLSLKESAAARMLQKMNVDAAQVVADIESQISRGDSRPSQDMTLTPRAKRVIDLAYDEAQSLKHNYIGTEHLLLGIIRERNGLGGKALAKHGATLQSAREAVKAVESEGPESTPERASRPPPAHSATSPRTEAEVDGLSKAMRRALFVAHEIALAADETLVGPEDMLRGLLRDREGDFVELLTKLGVDPVALEKTIELQPTEKNLMEQSLSTLTPRLQRLIRFADSDAEATGSRNIEPVHFLLATLREPEPIPSLASTGLTYNAVRKALKE